MGNEEKGNTGSLVEEEEDAGNRLCGKAIQGKSHLVAECELYYGKRNVIEGEMIDSID